MTGSFPFLPTNSGMFLLDYEGETCASASSSSFFLVLLFHLDIVFSVVGRNEAVVILLVFHEEVTLC
jgi:hypothetical protein